MHPVKCVAVGDGMVGKTSLLMSNSMQAFPSKCSTHNVPIILVGTKLDLRNQYRKLSELNEEDQFIQCCQGEFLAKDIKAVKYMECSSLNMVGVNEVFDEVAKVALSPSRQGPPKCKLL